MKNLLLLAFISLIAIGCGGDKPEATTTPEAGTETISTMESKETPVFTLLWSEYPSWSALGVGEMRGIIDGRKGHLSPIEEKNGIDIVLKQMDYDPCLTGYATGTADAVCMTNIDALNPTLQRPGTAILPTSTSDGGDGLLTVGIDDIEGLKTESVYGLEKSVSQYAFYRGLEQLGQNPDDYTFENLDPGAAATSLQNGDKNSKVKAIFVWNPYLLQTQRTRKDSKLMFDSTNIPGEIIDMVLVGNDSLEKEGGKSFATAICQAYYEINALLAESSSEKDAVTVEIGEKFSNLGLEDMKVVLQQTKFYSTAEAGASLFESEDFKTNMNTVVETANKIGILEGVSPTIGYGDSSAQLNFDSSYMKSAK